MADHSLSTRLGHTVLRVVGTDPGTSSLDLLLLENGRVRDQRRFTPEELQRDPQALEQALLRWAPLDLIAGPSGYGLPLVRGENLTEDHLDQMSLVRPDERGQRAGVVGFRSWVRTLLLTGQPVVFLPGGWHLQTIPSCRKVNSVDLGTADKIAVVALALWFDAQERGGFEKSTFAVVEIGSAFSAILVVQGGKLVDASAGTRGPIGILSRGVWDGEIAYWQSPLSKRDLFHGGLDDLGPLGPDAFRESLIRGTAGLQAVTPFQRIYLSGRGLDRPDVAALACAALSPLGEIVALPSLPDTSAKHAAQGSAILADGLAGGSFGAVVEALEIRQASGSIWDAVARLL
ncbi:MAG: DUF1464 family protein [Isosphaeraceae bacterium]